MPSQWTHGAWSLLSKGFTHQRQPTPSQPIASQPTASHWDKTTSRFHVKSENFFGTSQVCVERSQESKLEASERNGGLQLGIYDRIFTRSSKGIGPPSWGSREPGWVNKHPKGGNSQEELPVTLAALGGLPKTWSLITREVA